MMLAVMTFHPGILIAACVGLTVGFFVFQALSLLILQREFLEWKYILKRQFLETRISVNKLVFQINLSAKSIE